MPPKISKSFEFIDSFTTAIGNEELSTIKATIKKKGVNVNVRNSSGWLPLHLITKDTPLSIKIWRLLRKAGAEFICSKGENTSLSEDKRICPLGYYLKQRQYHLIYAVLQDLYPSPGVPVERFPEIIVTEKGIDYILIFYFILYGDLETLKILIDTLEDTAYLNLRQDNVSLLMFITNHPLKNEVKSSELIKIIFYLLHKGSNPHETDENGKGILQYLIAQGTPQDVKNFIDNYDPVLTHCDNNNNTMIHYIAKYTRADLIDLFTEQGIDLNSINNERNTALHILLNFLTENGYDTPKETPEFKLVTALLSQGVEINHSDGEGYTERHFAEKLDDYQTLSDMQDYAELNQIFSIHSKIIKLKQAFEKAYQALDFPIQNIENADDIIRESFKLWFSANAGNEVEFNGNQQQLQNIVLQIQNMTYVKYPLLTLYRIVISLLKKDFKISLEINSRFPKKIPQDTDYYYTFYNEKFVKLTTQSEEQETIIYSLMTSLVYHADKYSLDDNKSQYYHGLICKINGDYAHYDLEAYKKELKQIEKKYGTYFGENPSSDSDSEQEQQYQILPQRKKSLIHDYTARFFKKSGIENILAAKGDKIFNKINTIKGKAGNRASRQELSHNFYQLTEQEQRDLDRLNHLSLSGELNAKTLNTLKTNFYIAQYRGISYRTDEGSRSVRKYHRLSREEGQPQFSRATIAAEGYSSHIRYVQALKAASGARNSIIQNMLQSGEHTQIQLHQLAASGPITIQLIGKSPYTFDHALHALQDLYTKNYAKFHRYLAQYVKNFIPTEQDPDKLKIDTLEDAIAHSISSSYSPFVSTSDTPEHALLYAYGDKYYPSFKEKRLRPRWRKDGRAERPYSGKVYISLHEPLELVTRSHHIPTLNEQGKVRINNLITPERETTFFGFIPPDKVVSQHIAKYPSFKGDYKEIYFEKYGLTKDFYNIFQRELLRHKPHSDKRKEIIRILTHYLVSYQEVCLIEEAHIAARQRNGILIYRNEFGGFSLYPCKTQEPSNISNKNKNSKKAAQASTQNRQEKRHYRITIADDKLGFLKNLLSNYVIVPSHPQNRTLQFSLAYLLGRPEQEIIALMMDDFGIKLSEADFLQRVSEYYKSIICIHDPNIKQYMNVIKPQQNSIENEINLYALGNNSFSSLKLRTTALEPKKLDQHKKRGKPSTKKSLNRNDQARNKRKSIVEISKASSKFQKTTHTQENQETSPFHPTSVKTHSKASSIYSSKDTLFQSRGHKQKLPTPRSSTSQLSSLLKDLKKYSPRYLRAFLYELTFATCGEAEAMKIRLTKIVPHIIFDENISSSSTSYSIGINLAKLVELSEKTKQGSIQPVVDFFLALSGNENTQYEATNLTKN